MPDRTSIALPTLIALVMGSVALLGSMKPWSSARPDLPSPQKLKEWPAPEPLFPVPARLWEDPLVALQQWVETEQKARKSDKSTPANPPVPTVEEFLKEIRRRHHVDAGLEVLLVHMQGSPYFEDAENRRRTRVAIFEAMSHLHYAPVNGERLGCVRMSRKAIADCVLEWQTGEETTCGTTSGAETNFADFELFPVELFREDHILPHNLVAPHPAPSDEDHHPAVVVVYVNDQLFEDVFLHVQDLIIQAWAGPKRADAQVRVIGPTRSDLLAKMSNELDQLADARRATLMDEVGIRQQFLRKLPRSWPGSDAGAALQVFSPWATISDTALTSAAHDDHGTHAKIENGKPESRGLVRANEAKGGRRLLVWPKEPAQPTIKLWRVMGSDEQLADALFRELRLRGITEAGRVGLLVEWDSGYGRALYHHFVKKYGNVPAWRYARGLDGRAAAVALKTSGTEERSAGNTRLDYLTRLAQLIKDRERAAGRPLLAIGVFGSDVYDKAALLAGLKSRLKNKVFFTTDLDARFLDDAELPHLDDLIVASHFGLSVGGRRGRSCEEEPIDLGTMSAPFRGCYQTASYLATIFALDHEGVGSFEDAILARRPTDSDATDADRSAAEGGGLGPPMAHVFELGRKGVIDLSARGDPDSPYYAGSAHRKTPIRTTLGVLLYVAAILMGLLGYLFVTTPRPANGRLTWRDRAPAMAVAAMAIGIPIILLTVSRQPDEEPLAWFEGVSAWPVFVLRILLTALCAHYLIVMRRRTIQSNDEIGAEFDLASSWSEARKNGASASRLFFWDIYNGRWKAPRDVGAVWNTYLGEARFKIRLPRILFFAALFAFVGSLIMLIDGWPQFPVRGPFSRFFCIGAFYASWIFLFLLLATTIDALGLTIGFVRALSVSEDPLTWQDGQPSPEVDADVAPSPSVIPPEIRTRWRALRMMGSLISQAESFFYFPFVALLAVIVIRHPSIEDIALTPGTLILGFGLLGIMIAAAITLNRAGGIARDRFDLEALVESALASPADDTEGESDANETDSNETDANETDANETDSKDDAETQKKKQEALGALSKEVAAYQAGAFQTVLAGPVFKALAIPGGGIGALALVDWIAKLQG